MKILWFLQFIFFNNLGSLQPLAVPVEFHVDWKFRSPGGAVCVRYVCILIGSSKGISLKLTSLLLSQQTDLAPPHSFPALDVSICFLLQQIYGYR